MREKNLFFLTGFLSLFFCLPADAVTVNISGEITRSTCQINNGQPVTVDFGDNLHIASIKKGGISKPVAFTVTCATPPTGLISLKISGEETSPGSGLLKTSSSGLAIAISQTGKSYPVNTEFAFSYYSQPVLVAGLYVSAEGVAPGPFSATAMMIIEYS